MDETVEFFKLFTAKEMADRLQATDLRMLEYRRAALLKQMAEARHDCEYLDATVRTIEFRLDNLAYTTIARLQAYLGDYSFSIAMLLFLFVFLLILSHD